jgi:Glycosyltransferase family 87
MPKQMLPRITPLSLLYFFSLCIIPAELYFFFFIPKLFNEQVMFQEILAQPYFLLDACKFYVCGVMARSPEYLPNLYDPQVQASVFRQLLHCGTTFLWPPTPGETVYFTPNEYPPTFDALMIIGTLLPLRIFLIVWTFAIPVLSIILITFVLRKLSNLSKVAMLGWWLVTLSSYYIYYNVFVGQTAMLVSALAALFFWGLLEKKDWLVAVSLCAMAIFKPHYAIVFITASLCTRRYKALLVTALIGISVLCATACVVGPHVIFDYPHQLALIQKDTASGQYYYNIEGMCNLLCPMILIFGKKLGFLLSYPIMLIGLALIGFVWWRAYKAGPHAYPFAFATTLALSVITSAHANNYDLVIFFAGWAVTIPALSLSKIRLLDNRYHRFWCYLFLLYPFIVDFMVLTNCAGGPYNLAISFTMLTIAYLALDLKMRESLAQN